MSILTHRIATSALSMRSVALATLLGATFLAAPVVTAQAADAVGAPTQLRPAATATPIFVAANETKSESVEERIAALRTALKITPDQEPKWKVVAQTMRDNSADMQKLAAEKTVKAPQTLTAVEDLQNYEQFAQLHVHGLKNLTAAFETLYKTMPDAQKKIADKVFQGYGNKNDPSRG